MIYLPKERVIKINKEPNELDRFVIEFVNLLNKDYVIVSGYVSILTGRSRATEDVDLLVPKMNLAKFKKLWANALNAGFECLNTSNTDEAYKMMSEHAIRFARTGKPIPNIEFKLIKNDIDQYSFDKKVTVELMAHKLLISPLEMQIAYKLFLGSEKDLEDAKHIYILFKQNINKSELSKLCIGLKVLDKMDILK